MKILSERGYRYGGLVLHALAKSMYTLIVRSPMNREAAGIFFIRTVTLSNFFLNVYREFQSHLLSTRKETGRCGEVCHVTLDSLIYNS